MTGTRTVRYRVTCHRTPYISEPKARAAVATIRRHSQVLLSPYVCHCGHWHIARTSKGVISPADAGFENLFRVLVANPS
jgi:hypothetical protein